jgi:hypothetical protein
VEEQLYLQTLSGVLHLLPNSDISDKDVVK